MADTASAYENIITDIIKREGPASNDPVDKGGRTAYGISEKANPEAWADGKVTEAEARAIYERKYVTRPGFHLIPFPKLRNHLIDFGVTSGPILVIQKLQTILGVPVDGKLGEDTLAALAKLPWQQVNNDLVRERVAMIGRLVKKDPTQLKFINGWLDRAFQFLV